MSSSETGGRGNGRYPFSAYPRGWFRAAYSADIAPGEVQTLHFFGQDLVLFRTASGEARVFDPHCPHLGAHLGYGGVVAGEHLRCPFHHWEFDGEGVCQKIPYARRIPPRAKLRAWPVVEMNGLIMFYHDLEGRAPSFEVPVVPEVGDAEWTQPEIMRWKVKAHWLDMNENCVDQAHFLFIHETLTIPPTTARIDGHVHTAESLFTMRAPGGEVEANLTTIDHGPGLQLVRMDGLIDTLMINTSTPIDEEWTDVSFAYSVKAANDPEKEGLARAIVKDLKQQFEHDRPIWENKAHWERPVLCEGDGPISTYRKWYSQFV